MERVMRSGEDKAMQAVMLLGLGSLRRIGFEYSVVFELFEYPNTYQCCCIRRAS